MKRTLLAICVLAGALLAAAPAAAQAVHDGNNTGFPPFGTFHGSNFDVVSLQNGNLHIEIPIVSVPQRGGRTLTYRFVYDSPTWHLIRQDLGPYQPPFWIVNPVEPEAANFRLVGPGFWQVKNELSEQYCSGSERTAEYWLYSGWTATDSNGTKHPFALRYETYDINAWGFVCTDGSLPRGNQLTGVALDGTGIVLDVSENPQIEWGTITLKDGSLYGTKDSNGNLLDTLGRPILTFGSGPNGTGIWTAKNSNGADQQYLVEYESVAIQTSFCSLISTVPPDDCMEWPETISQPKKLTLPNGKFYLFTWAQNSYGELLRVDLPTGGSISYTYQPKLYKVAASQQGGDGRSRQGSQESKTGRLQVTSRTVSDGQTSNTWEYFTSPAGRVVRDPLGNEEVHVYGPIGTTTTTNGTYEKEVRIYQGSSASGTLLRTIKKDYAGDQGPNEQSGPDHKLINARMIRETLILEDGQTSKIETDYETFSTSYLGWSFTATRLNVAEKREYAYGAGAPGALVRKTTYGYLHTNNQPYLDRHIVDRVTTSVVRDGVGNIIAQTVNEYDIYSEAIAATSAVQHDSANFGPSFTIRGNVTAAKRWRNTDGAWLETRHLKFDDTGNILKTRHPSGHVTIFNYDDSWANSACAPAGAGRAYLKSATNALGHVTSYTYNSCTGSVASTTDPNLQTTTFTYDAYDRADLTNLPDSGQMDRDYDDTARIVTSKTKRTSSAWLVSKAHYDVLGRVWRQELCEDGSPTCLTSIKTDTTFDAVGRAWKVTNPYRTTSDTTYGVTESVFDGLGRVTKLRPPDGTLNPDSNIVVTQYAGNTVTVTDQAGKQRRSYADGLGRLVRVDEPGPVPGTPGAGSATVAGTLQTSGGSSATPGTGSATVNGSLQSVPGSPATPGTGSVNITGSEQSVEDGEWVEECALWDMEGYCLEWQWVWYGQTYWDSGEVSITVNGFAKSVSYGQSSDGATIASALANAFNADGASPVTASASGTVVYLTSKTTGAVSNYPLSATSWTNDPQHFSSPSFVPVRSGPTLTGGANAGPTVYDSGNVWVTVNGSTKSVSYGQGSTNTSVATALRDAINGDTGYPVTASLSGSTLNLTSKTTGAATNYSLSGGSSTSQPGTFSQPSFTVAASGSTLTGGTDGSSPIYDSGNVWVIVNGLTKSVSYGQGSTNTSVATALRDAVNADGGYPVTASLSGATLTLTAKSSGASTNYSLSAGSTTSLPGTFAQPSFTVSVSGSSLTGGTDGGAGSLATPAVTTYTYDTLDNLTQVLQSGSRQRTFTYNSLSQLTQAVNPESGAISYTYDNDGNLLTKVAPAPNQTGSATVTTTYAYDVLHRLTQKSYNDGTGLAQWFYDETSVWGQNMANPVGRLTHQQAFQGSTMISGALFHYDAMGRVVQRGECTPSLCGWSGFNVFTTYDLAGNVVTLTYPSGRKVTYGYDSASRLNRVTFDSFNGTPVNYNYLSAASYAPHGAPSSLTLGNGLVETTTYNNRLQPGQMRAASGPEGSGLTAMDYSYNFSDAQGRNNGNVLAIHDLLNSGRTQTFTYDELNRIQTAQSAASSGANCWGLNFGYDIWGNLLSSNVTKCSAPMLSLSVNANNRITNPGFNYDPAGNLTGDGVSAYVYDAENRLTNAGWGAGIYTYDAEGQRVRKQTGSAYTEYIYFGGQVIAERDQAGTWTDYVFVGGRRLAKAPATAATSGTEYYHGDHLGSARVITDAAGNKTWEAVYLPYGQEWSAQGTTNHYKFTGKERDPESGLDFFIARYYSSGYGRFLSPDEFTGGPVDAFSSSDPLPPGPLPYADITDPQSLNKYSYTYNNPLNFVDTNGHCPDAPVNCADLKTAPLAPKVGSGTLDAAGFAPPPVGPAADGANVLVSLSKGDFKGAAVNLVAMIPVLGDAFKGGKMGLKATERGLLKEAEVLKDMGLAKNTEKVLGKEGKAIPDGLNPTDLVEIKDAKRVTDSKQLRIESEAAKATNRSSTLVTGTNTNVTQNAARRFVQTIRRPDLGPKVPK